MKEYSIDLELAKKLKEKGFLQNSYFYYDDCSKEDVVTIMENRCYGINKISAPTSDEMLKELPKYINYKNRVCNIQIIYDDGYWFTGYSYIGGEFEIVREDKKLCNALSYLWLKLKEEDYIK